MIVKPGERFLLRYVHQSGVESGEQKGIKPMAKYSLRRINEVSAQAVARINDLIEIYEELGTPQVVGELLGYKEGLIGTFALADQKLRYATPLERIHVEEETVESAFAVFGLLLPQMDKFEQDVRAFA